MAGAITHLLVAEAAKNKVDGDSLLGKALEKYSEFLLLGSVSPDLPYSKVLSRQEIWADRMHYVSTNGIARLGTSGLRLRPDKESDLFQCSLAWLAGYVAHCVTDATIHPIVQAIVGPYAVDPDRHRICEMVQDAKLYGEIKGANLRESHFIGGLTPCIKPSRTNFDSVVGFWFTLLHLVYSGAPPDPDVEEWYQAYKKMIGKASDSELVEALSRPFERAKEYLYSSSEALNSDRAQEVETYYNQVPVPSKRGEVAEFREVGFARAVENVGQFWRAMMAEIERGSGGDESRDLSKMARILPNWNLDTGADMDTFDPAPTLWRS